MTCIVNLSYSYTLPESPKFSSFLGHNERDANAKVLDKKKINILRGQKKFVAGLFIDSGYKSERYKFNDSIDYYICIDCDFCYDCVDYFHNRSTQLVLFCGGPSVL